MTRKELDEIVAGLTEERLALLSFIETTAREAMVQQDNDADARIETYTAPLTLDPDGSPIKDEKGNYVGGKLAVAEKVHADAIAKKDADHEKAIKEAANKAATELAAAKAETAARDATIATQQALIDAMGGTPMGQQLAKDRERDRLLKAKADAEAALAKLDAPIVAEVDRNTVDRTKLRG